MNKSTDMALALGIPSEFSGESLEGMDFGIYQGGDRLRAALVSLRGMLERGKYFAFPVFLLFDGGYGVGKTRAACHLLEAAYKGFKLKRASRSSNVRPQFLRASKASRSRFDDDSVEKLMCEESPFLVLDDVNRIAGYKGEESFVEDVVEERRDAGLSTLITINTPLEQIEGRFGSYLKTFTHIRFSAPDQRGKR